MDTRARRKVQTIEFKADDPKNSESLGTVSIRYTTGRTDEFRIGRGEFFKWQESGYNPQFVPSGIRLPAGTKGYNDYPEDLVSPEGRAEQMEKAFQECLRAANAWERQTGQVLMRDNYGLPVNQFTPWNCWGPWVEGTQTLRFAIEDVYLV